jgi:DNA-directed RNA polymerase subunit RPC12/RpoP
MIRRTYGCNACNREWTLLHDSSDETCTSCPYCGAGAGWRPKPLRIKTNKSRAVDIAQQEMERMGHANFRDGNREGDVAAMGLAPQHTAEKEAMIRQTVQATREMANAMTGTISPEMQASLKQFNSQSPATAPAAPPQGQVVPLNPQIMAQAKQATSETKSQNGGSPMELLHRGVKTQADPIKTARMMARHEY